MEEELAFHPTSGLPQESRRGPDTPLHALQPPDGLLPHPPISKVPLTSSNASYKPQWHTFNKTYQGVLFSLIL